MCYPRVRTRKGMCTWSTHDKNTLDICMSWTHVDVYVYPKVIFISRKWIYTWEFYTIHVYDDICRCWCVYVYTCKSHMSYDGCNISHENVTCCIIYDKV